MLTPFSGKIDDIRIYKRSLSESEIQELYHEGNWDINDGLLAYFPFNGNANDESSNENNGIVYGATPVADRFGRTNSAYDFDGVDDYIDMGLFPLNFEYTTVNFWFKTTDGNNNYEIFHINRTSENAGGLASGVGTVLDGQSANILKFAFRDELYQSGLYPYLLSDTEVNDGKWHQATFVYDGNARLYIDGKIEDELQRDSKLYSLNDSILRIGTHTHHPIGNYHFDGSIDDIRIYNRALSDYEIKQLATGSTTSYYPDEVLISVFNSATGESISGAVVSINSESGITDGSGIVTFDSLSAGEYELSIQAAGYNTFSSLITVQANGDMSLSYGLTAGAGGDAPVVTDVVSSYSSRSEEAFFLYGTSFPLSFTANIDWNGKTPYSVQFITSTETYVQSIASDEDLTITLDVGKDFDPGGRLSVVAVAADGSVSTPFDANIEVMSQIFGTEVLQMPVKQQNGTFSYNREVELGATIFKPKEETEHPVPEEIPFFGKKEPKFVPQITFDVSIEKNIAVYTVKSDIDNKDKEMEILGQKVEAGMTVGGQLIFQYAPDNDTWTLKDTGILLEPSLSADFIKTPPYYYFLPTPVGPIPIYFRAALGASIYGSVNIQGFNFYDNEWSLAGSIEPGLKGSVSMGTGVADALAVEGILGAKATFGMGFEQFDTVLEGLTIGMSGSVKIYLLFLYP